MITLFQHFDAKLSRLLLVGVIGLLYGRGTEAIRSRLKSVPVRQSSFDNPHHLVGVELLGVWIARWTKLLFRQENQEFTVGKPRVENGLQ
jgi:hypothetical protein